MLRWVLRLTPARTCSKRPMKESPCSTLPSCTLLFSKIELYRPAEASMMRITLVSATLARICSDPTSVTECIDTMCGKPTFESIVPARKLLPKVAANTAGLML